MSSEVAIRVENLSKKYFLKHPIINESGEEVNEFWALKDISFEIKKGESVGIIGPNGSGKSTLLKILAGVTKPSTGKVEIFGRVASILDIGAGFHPELSGRENVFLNGQIHGFTKKEIAAKFDAIVEFSGIEKFIDEPVKNYSNGMYLRLAFSIMAHLDFDVYLFDEVFNVGDADFASKTKDKFHEMVISRKTLLFISHDIKEILSQKQFLLISKGKLEEMSFKKNTLSNYLENILSSGGLEINKQNHFLTEFSRFQYSDEVRMISVSLTQPQKDSNVDFSTKYPFYLDIEFEKLNINSTIDVILNLLDSTGNVILTSSPFVSGQFNGDVLSSKFAYRCTIPEKFLNGQIYYVSLYFVKNIADVALNYLDTQANQSIEYGFGSEIVLELDKIIAFKPVLQIPNFNFDPSLIINTQIGILPNFNWELVNLK